MKLQRSYDSDDQHARKNFSFQSLHFDKVVPINDEDTRGERSTYPHSLTKRAYEEDEATFDLSSVVPEE